MKKEDSKKYNGFLFKAKDLNGNWVDGYYEHDSSYKEDECSDCIWQIHKRQKEGFSNRMAAIDPSTLCQQVRGTELFEGDEVVNAHGVKGYIKWNENIMTWYVAFQGSGDVEMLAFARKDWKPTGKNIHDLKAEEK